MPLSSNWMQPDNWFTARCWAGTVGIMGITIAVDAQHDIYVGGFTHGSFPVTPGVAQFNFGGAGDGFVAKLQTTPVSTALVFATYLGGNSWEAVAALAVDENGYMYLAMGTHSTNFPTTPGAFDRVCNNCATNIKTDGAIVELNPDASQLVYSTLFGSNTATTSSMGFSGIAIDAAGNAVVSWTNHVYSRHADNPRRLSACLWGRQL